MITSSQKTSYQYLRKIMVLPVAAVVVALFAFSYKNKKQSIPAIKFEKPVTVVIDAGHGMDPSGSPTGVTASDGSREDDIVLSIAKKIKELNTNDQVKIILTREDKNTVDLKKRVEFVNAENADLLISLHTNAASKEEKDTKGIDVLFSDKNEKHYAESKILATILYNYFYQVHAVNNIQSPKNHVYIIDNSNCPSALVECGYLTDPADRAFVKDEKGQVQIAKTILQSIEQYFLQKQASDWQERKRAVADTAWPAITFSRNATTGRMEGSYNGKKINKISYYEGQLAFFFDDDSPTMVMISKEQTQALKKKYGKDLDELVAQDPGKKEAEEKKQQELKEVLALKQTESDKAQAETKELTEEKQLKAEKQEAELKKLLALKQPSTEKTQKELMNLKQLRNEEEQVQLKKEMNTLQYKNGEDALKKLERLNGEQLDAEKMQKELQEMILLKQREMRTGELEKIQKEQEELEKKLKTNTKKAKS